jgi:hypothetical protein
MAEQRAADSACMSRQQPPQQHPKVDEGEKPSPEPLLRAESVQRLYTSLVSFARPNAKAKQRGMSAAKMTRPARCWPLPYSVLCLPYSERHLCYC